MVSGILLKTLLHSFRKLKHFAFEEAFVSRSEKGLQPIFNSIVGIKSFAIHMALRERNKWKPDGAKSRLQGGSGMSFVWSSADFWRVIKEMIETSVQSGAHHPSRQIWSCGSSTQFSSLWSPTPEPITSTRDAYDSLSSTTTTTRVVHNSSYLRSIQICHKPRNDYAT